MLRAQVPFNHMQCQTNDLLEMNVRHRQSRVGPGGWALALALAWFVEKPAFFLETATTPTLEQSGYHLLYTSVCACVCTFFPGLMSVYKSA